MPIEWNFLYSEILGHIERPVIPSQAASPLECRDDMLLVTIPWWPVRGREEREAMWRSWHDCIQNSGAKNVGLLEFGDEQGESTSWHYSGFDYVLRHYYFPKYDDMPNVTWIPNGYTSETGPRVASSLPPASLRNTFCYFEGSVQGGRSEHDRKELAEALASGKSTSHCSFRDTGLWAGGSSKFEYTLKLQDTIFALCPEGNSPETLRLYEAMENGAIPVVKRGSDVMVGHPYPWHRD